MLAEWVDEAVEELQDGDALYGEDEAVGGNVDAKWTSWRCEQPCMPWV